MEALANIASLVFMCSGIYIYVLHRKLKKGNFEANDAFRIQQNKKKAWIALAVSFVVAGVALGFTEDEPEQLPPENQNAIIASDNQDASDKLNGDAKEKTEDSNNQSPTDDQEGQLDIASKDKTDDTAAASDTAGDTDVQANTNTTAEPEVTPAPAPTPEPEPEPEPTPAPASNTNQEFQKAKEPIKNVTSSYIANSSTGKFHYASCSSVEDMSNSNKVEFDSAEAAKAAGYVPCKRCDPH